MKVISSSVSFCLFLLLLITTDNYYSYPSGVSGYTLKTNSSGCGACHGTHSGFDGNINVVIAGPSILSPGETGNYTVTISGGSGSKVGTDIAASAGTLDIVNNNLIIRNGELTHPSPKSFSGGQYTFYFKFTAPSTEGDQILYATGMSSKKHWNFAANFTVNVELPFIPPPTNLTATFIPPPNTKVILNWADNSSNETGFAIERKTGDAGTYSQLAVVGENATSYEDISQFLDETNYYYRVFAMNDDTVSDYSNEAGIYTILPVELISFTAAQSDDAVILKWETSTETNNFGFEIERKSGTSKFKSVGFVRGAGTSIEKCRYRFSDQYLPAGSFTYRLKQIDYNGEFVYSQEVNTELIARRFFLSQNYPNPFNPSTVIRYSIPASDAVNGAEEHVSLKIYDVLGCVVAELVNRQQPPGKYEMEFNAGNLPSGIYFYRLNAGSFSDVRKMILSK